MTTTPPPTSNQKNKNGSKKLCMSTNNVQSMKVKLINLTYRGSAGAVSFAGVLAIPQGSALAVKRPAVNRNSVDTLEFQPVTGVFGDPII